MFQIKMHKAEVIAVLEANLIEHQTIYQKAIEIYRVRVVDDLNAKIDAVKAGKYIEHYIRLPIPEEHSDDYKRVIAMLKADIGDEVGLNEAMFQTYIENNWGWQKAFATNSTSYLQQ